MKLMKRNLEEYEIVLIQNGFKIEPSTKTISTITHNWVHRGYGIKVSIMIDNLSSGEEFPSVAMYVGTEKDFVPQENVDKKVARMLWEIRDALFNKKDWTGYVYFYCMPDHAIMISKLKDVDYKTFDAMKDVYSHICEIHKAWNKI